MLYVDSREISSYGCDIINFPFLFQLDGSRMLEIDQYTTSYC